MLRIRNEFDMAIWLKFRRYGFRTVYQGMVYTFHYIEYPVGYMDAIFCSYFCVTGQT